MGACAIDFEEGPPLRTAKPQGVTYTYRPKELFKLFKNAESLLGSSLKNLGTFRFELFLV